MDLGLQLERELSPARYLRQHSGEFSVCSHQAIVLAAIETAVALEDCNRGRARRQWCLVLKGVRAAGAAARRDGLTPRRLVFQVDRLREAMETVLFDGFLPPELAAWAARSAAKMCTRAVDHALCAYWSQGDRVSGGFHRRASHSSTDVLPAFRGYEPEPRMRIVDPGSDART